MARIVVTEFVSLDGVMEDPGGAEDYKHGGWALQIERGEEGDKFKLDETMDADALLLGRVTHEGFADAWPSRTGEFADKFNTMPKYVVSSTLGDDPGWTNSTVIDGDVVATISELRAGPGGDIVVHGSARLAQTLLEHELVEVAELVDHPHAAPAARARVGHAPAGQRIAEAAVVGDLADEVLVVGPDAHH